MAKAEKIDRGCWGRSGKPVVGPIARRHLKKVTRRLRRRAWRLLGEDAPVRVRDFTRGWFL